MNKKHASRDQIPFNMEIISNKYKFQMIKKQFQTRKNKAKIKILMNITMILKTKKTVTASKLQKLY